MSKAAREAVWEHSIQQGNARLMLLAIAEFSDDHGFAYPGMERLAARVKTVERNAKKLIRQLEEAGELIVLERMGIETSHGSTNAYLIVLEGIQNEIPAWWVEKRLAALSANGVNGQTPREVNNETPLGVNGGAPQDTARGMAGHPRGEPSDTREVNEETPLGVNGQTPKSSGNPSDQPSGKSPEAMDELDENFSEADFPAATDKQKDGWLAAMSQLEIQLDRAGFETWLRGAQLLGSEDGVFVIGARNKYARDMLQHRLYRNVRRVLSDCYGQQVELRFVVSRPKPPCEDGEMPLYRLLRNQPDEVDAVPAKTPARKLSLVEAEAIARARPGVRNPKAYARAIVNNAKAEQSTAEA